MTQREREQVTRRHLYRYAQYVRDVQQYEQSVFGTSPQNETGIRGSEISDPTARSGIALADPSRALEQKRKWIDAIDAAMRELAQMDAGAERGYTYICTHIYGLDGQKHKRKENSDTAAKIAEECFLSIRALYGRITTIVNIVIFHAAERGLFEKKE